MARFKAHRYDCSLSAAWLLAAVLCLPVGFLHAQQPGTEFWFSFGKTYYPSSHLPTNYEINISSPHHAKGSIIFWHTGEKVQFNVLPGHVFNYRLSTNQSNACLHNIYGKNNMSVQVSGDSAFHVSVLASQIGSSDATSLLPVDEWGTEYCFFRQSGKSNLATDEVVLIVAASNNTVVTIGGNSLCTLDMGETFYAQIPASATSRKISSNNPVALFDVEQLSYVPNDGCGSSDKSLEQYFPIQNCGKDFFIPVTHMGREFVQVVALEDSTNISQNGGKLRTDISGVGRLGGLHAEEWAWIEIVRENHGCFISADKPVMVLSFMTGNRYYLKNGYGDPSVVWVPATANRVKSCIIKPFVINGSQSAPPGEVPVKPIWHSIVVTSAAGKNSCTVSAGNGAPRPLYGGVWVDHPSGWSYYDMPLDKDTTYTFSNNAFGLQAYSYGLAQVESYHLLASVPKKELQVSFTANDTHFLKLPDMFFCEQAVTFNAEIKDSISSQPGHIKWYVDSVEETAARDQLVWKKHFTKGTYHIRMEIRYNDWGGTASVSSILRITSLEADVSTTPEHCHQSDGRIILSVRSEAPASLVFELDSSGGYSNPINGLKSGWYHLRISDAYCEWQQQVYIDSSMGPKADFDVSDTVAVTGMKILFTDRSVPDGAGLAFWHWEFGDNSSCFTRNATHEYRTENVFNVQLVVTDSSLCSDTTEKNIRVLPQICFPNAFAPESEMEGNRFFHPMDESEKYHYSSFDMTVYNRWGNTVWHQHCEGGGCPHYHDSGFWWDGTDSQGRPLNAGVFFYVVKVTFNSSDSQPLLIKGSVTLFR